MKKALLLQLVGGVTRKLPDGMRIRGDINVCLMGKGARSRAPMMLSSALPPCALYYYKKGNRIIKSVLSCGVTGFPTEDSGVWQGVRTPRRTVVSGRAGGRAGVEPKKGSTGHGYLLLVGSGRLTAETIYFLSSTGCLL